MESIDIVNKYRKLFHFDPTQIGYSWLAEMAIEIISRIDNIYRASETAELAATGERTGGGIAQPTGRSTTCLCDPCIKLCSIRPFVVDGSVVLTNCNMITS